MACKILQISVEVGIQTCLKYLQCFITFFTVYLKLQHRMYIRSSYRHKMLKQAMFLTRLLKRSELDKS